MTLKTKIKRILKREKPGLQALIRPSPYLNLMVQQIISLQEENGSWFNNVYLTSKATLALYEYYNFSGKDIHGVLNRSINYLKNQLRNLTEEILSLEHLYPRLDQTILNYSSILVTLYILNQLDLDKRVILAFEKLEKEAVKYVDSLSDIKIASNLVLVYKIKNLKIKPNEKLLRYLINKIYSENSLDAAIPVITLYQEHSQFLDGIWNKLRRSYTNEEVGLYQFVIGNVSPAIDSLDKNSSVDLIYNALLITKEIAENKNFIKKLGEIVLDKIENVLVSSSDFNHPKIHEMSLLVLSLLRTPFKEAVFIPKIQANHLINAMRWYDIKLKEGVLPITNRRYIVFVLTSSISIGALFFTILYFLIKQSTPVSLAAASIIAGSIWFILDRIMKKPPIEK